MSRHRALVALVVLLAGAPAALAAQRSPFGRAPPDRERATLGAAFVRGHPLGLAGLLHAGLIVRPPEPDSALAGPPARAYLLRLAAASGLDESRLRPQTFALEGSFVLEQGTWIVRAGDRALASRYHLRWRRAGSGWQVVLLRWTRFR